MFSPPYLFRIESPVVIFNGRLFQAGALHPEATQDYIDIRTTRHALAEISTPSDIEALQQIHEVEAVQEYKQRYVQETMQRTLLSKDFVEQQITSNKALSFIVNKVLPIITESQLEQQIDSILTGQTIQHSLLFSQQQKKSREREETRETGEPRQEIPPDQKVQKEAQRMKQELKKALEQEYKKYQGKEEKTPRTIQEELQELETTRYSRLKDSSVLNDLLIPNYRLMLSDGKVFSLLTAKEHIEQQQEHISESLQRKLSRITPTTPFEDVEDILKKNKDGIEKNYRSKIMNKLRTTRINIAGINLIPFYAGTTTELIEPYKKLLEWKIKEESLDENETHTRQLQAIARERESLETIARKGAFEKNGAGFESVNGVYYAYVKTPEYALKSPHNQQYYQFKSATVGVSIIPHGNGFEIGRPIIINNYKHPFLNSTGPMQSLCTGSYHYETRERGMTPEEKVLSRLSLGKQILLSGYDGTRLSDFFRPYRQLLQENFGECKISEEEARRKNLPILNIANNTIPQMPTQTINPAQEPRRRGVAS